MSSRQRARMAQQLRLDRAAEAASNRPGDSLSESGDEDSNGAEETTAGTSVQYNPPAFGLLCGDSDSSEDDAAPIAMATEVRAKRSELEERQTAEKPSRKKKKKAKKGKDRSGSALKVAEDTADDDIWAALEETEETREFPTTSKGSTLTDILKVDAKSLDVDSLIRQRFAGAAADMGERAAGGGRRVAGTRAGNAKQHVHRLGGAGRFIFGMPKDEWVKPPSYVGGGVGMAPARASATMGSAGDAATTLRLSGRQVFQFIWAEEYQKVNEQFISIQKSGDANRLVQFLSQYFYHQEGLLQLAMVFARTGQMDRASDLVRRCLFCLHCAEAEGFRPCNANVLLDPSVYENKIYFAAVFRHMQIVGMLGCPSVAANIAKLLLSLDPFGDTACVLLALDYYLITAGDAEDFENIFTNADQIIVGVDAANVDSMICDGKVASRPLILSDLPNWAFSSALCAFLRFKKSGVFSKYDSVDSAEDCQWEEVSDSRLRSALTRFPFFLHYILPPHATTPGAGGSKVVGTASSVIMPKQWQELLSDRYFSALPESSDFAVLLHLGEIYRARSAVLWTNKKGAAGAGDFVDVEKWMYGIAKRILEERDTKTELSACMINWRDLCTRPELRKYLAAEVDDFMEEFPRLPPDANPLDPQFADPRALLPIARVGGDREAAARGMALPAGGAGRQNHNRRVVVNRGQGAGAGLAEEEEEAHIMRQLAQFEAQEEEMMQAMMAQQQEVDLLNQYENNAGGQHRRAGRTLLQRIAELPKPLKVFLLNIIEQRVKREMEDDSGDGINIADFINEESLMAEIAMIRDSDAEGGTRAVGNAEMQEIVSEVMKRTPEDIFSEHSALSSLEEAEANTLDLNQPLMQLFLRSFLPWNSLEPGAMRR